jgi:hypothetical protein
MSLVNKGNTPVNTFEEAVGNATGAITKYARLFRFKLGDLESHDILNVGNGFFDTVKMSTGNLVKGRIRLNSGNGDFAFIGDAQLDTVYTLVATVDTVAGQLKYFLDGVQIGDTVDVTNADFYSVTAKAKLAGSPLTGLNDSYIELAMWYGTLPSEDDIAAYPAKKLSEFSVLPTTAYSISGDGQTYVSSINSYIGADTISHTAGDTVGANRPIADGLVSTTKIIKNVFVGEIDGWQYALYDGSPIPETSVLHYAKGQHNGSAASAVLSDSTVSWSIDEWVGFILLNLTDGSWGVITANTATTTTATMTDGSENLFDVDDEYAIVQNVQLNDVISFDTLDGIVSMDNRGVPIISAPAGTYTFSFKLREADTKAVSEIMTHTLTVES